MKKLLFILLIPIAACAPWTRIAGLYEDPVHNFSVVIPEGWMKFTGNDYLLISSDGPFLQYICVVSRELDTHFSNTKRTMNAAMVPEESAEVILDDLGLDRSLINLQILENGPTRIAHQEGFRILFTYENGDGLPLRTVFYGFIRGRMFYSIRYTAAERYYFAKDVRIFKNVLESFRLLN